jgi:outer membrane scaffolding protein for murein synthesis (MipA/OmpV family)
MKNRNLHPESPCSFPCRSLKKMVPGVVLALLTTPVLAAEQKQSNELTLGGGVDVAPYYSGSDKSRVTTALVVDYAMANGFFVSSRAVSVTATTSANLITAQR